MRNGPFVITIDDQRLPAAASERHPRSGIQDARKARRFFWAVLSVATLASVSGNVTHAVLNAAPGAAVVSAIAAAVPPVVLLAGIHGPVALARSRSGAGVAYWSAMVMTVLLAAGAFALSFDALRALAMTAGIRPDLAWIWPLIVDLSIAQATLALGALSRNGHAPEAEPREDHNRRHPLPTAIPPTPADDLGKQPVDAVDSLSRDGATATPGEGERPVADDGDDAVTIIECDSCDAAEVADDTHPQRNAEARRRRGWRSEGQGVSQRDLCPSCASPAPAAPLESRDESWRAESDLIGSPA